MMYSGGRSYRRCRFQTFHRMDDAIELQALLPYLLEMRAHSDG